jgi:D-alanyl-D-alanine carboxypeptidase
MTREGPPLLSGGRRRRHLLAPLLGAALLAALAVLGGFLALRGAGGGGEETGDAPASAAEAAALDRARGSVAALQAGAGDPARFALELSSPNLVTLRFVRKPRAGLLFDVRTGRVLWRREEIRRLPIASLTKMMTALLIAEREDAHERVRVSRRATRTPGSGVGVLPKGRRVQLEALMNGLLLVSGNDAAVALAQHSAGSVPAFVRLMNERARELGLSCTRFSTPHGFEDRDNRSCAVDLAVLARADLAQRRIRRIARRSRAIVKFPIKGGRLFLYNNNPLIRAGYRGATGLKTGYTERAGRSIVATAKRKGIELGVVLLNSYDPGAQARKLLDRGFEALATERRASGG